MEHFVTHFNKLFLPQGLVLYESLLKNISCFKLWIVCIDQETYEFLESINLSHAGLINLKEVETKELIQVKKERTVGEYCWTLTPFVPRFVFESDITVKRVTYLDADLFFIKNPKPIYEEFEKSSKDILITDHSYSPEYDRSEESGQYCVQFIIFKRERGEIVRKWWEEKCIDWCYNRHEDGKFGDQKYLNDWPKIFSDKVHVLSHPEWTLAPWNATRYQYSKAIFYHFHGLKLVSNRKVCLSTYYILPEILISKVYKPYLLSLKKAIVSLENIDFKIIPQKQKRFLLNFLMDIFRGLKINMWRFITNRYENL